MPTITSQMNSAIPRRDLWHFPSTHANVTGAIVGRVSFGARAEADWPKVVVEVAEDFAMAAESSENVSDSCSRRVPSIIV